MRFYNQPHRFYCGVDLHARTMYATYGDCKTSASWGFDPASLAAP
jgi:hypothetical protein